MLYNILADWLVSFSAGLLTPLGAVCVLPLYPGFIAYLANKFSGNEAGKKTIILVGTITVAGVTTFMLFLGIIFTVFLKQSLTNVVGIVSPIAFGLLAFISIFLILDFDFGKYIPRMQVKTDINPLWSAFLFGFFFGAIIIPCNPGFIAAFFTRALISSSSFFIEMASFLFFGIGIGFPLFVLTVISATSGRSLINFLIKNKRGINLFAGSIMLAISLYYLFVVFDVF